MHGLIRSWADSRAVRGTLLRCSLWQRRQKTDNDLYEVILIESDDDFAVLCPGIPGAVSQGKDREEALKMIADAMAMAMANVPAAWDDDNPARQAELRELGKAKIAELVAECEEEGLEYYVCEVAPKLMRPWLAVG